LGALQALDPIIKRLPEVAKPSKPISFKGKLAWTTIVLTIYLIMGQIPLYPLNYSTNPSLQGAQIALMSIVFASKLGTLMQLGVGPIVTAGLIMQLLVGSKLINMDLTDPTEKALFTGAQKLLAIIFAAFEAGAYLVGGFFGSPPSGFTYPLFATLIFIQLFIAGVLVIYLDEILEKGWGFGSAVSLFILAGITQQIFSELLNPIHVGDGFAYGILWALGSSISNSTALHYIILRGGTWPSIVGLLTTIIVLIIVVYATGARVEIPIAYARYGGMRTKIPLQFLYVSNVPIILASALNANIIFFSQFLWKSYNPGNNNPILNLFFQFKFAPNATQPVPSGGLVYYMTPPRGLVNAVEDPMHAIGYILILTFLSVIFAIAWVNTSGMDARSQAENLVRSGIQIPGFRSSVQVIESMLNRYIPTLTWFSGLIVGLLAAFADILGALGTGMGILLAVGIVNQFYQILAAQRLEEEYPAVARILGLR